MRRLSIFLFTVLLTVGSWSILNAQGNYYKKYHINATFDGLEALPSGWASRTGNDAVFRNGGVAVREGIMALSGSGSGTRGIDIVFPTPQSNEVIGQSDTWFLEFDWIINGAAVGPKNALGLLISGSNSQTVNNGTTWYVDGIFGLYAFGDGFLHYMNLDPQGPENDLTEDPNDFYGPAIGSGDYPGFTRAGADATVAATVNASTLTEVAYATGKTYHITAELDFANQKVVNLTVTDKDDAANTQTFTDHAFLAPSLAGSAATVAVEDRVVNDLAMISAVNTRSTANGLGNGSNAALDVYLDNIDVYYLEPSQGIADVTINYKDRDGIQAKAPRVAINEQVSTVYSLITTDKEGFLEGTDYFAYDAEATHLANAGKGSNDGESVVVELNTGGSLDVIFKRTPITNGEYVWTGANGFNWNELEGNFSVSGGAAISYQPGNSVAFSDAAVLNKDIQLTTNLNLGEGDFTIAAEGYAFSGSGRVTGSGTLLIDAPTILALDNRLEGGALISTADPIQIKHAGAAAKFETTLPSVQLDLEPAAVFSTPINGNGGALSLSLLSDNTYSPGITGFSTVNINISNPGRAVSNNWSSPFTSVFEDGTVVNIRDIRESGALSATYAVSNTSLVTAKVNLGDNTRLIHNGTPADGATTSVKIGELSGTTESSLEGNSVGANRTIEWVVGGLNTDAVFNGRITPQLTKEPSRHSGDKVVYERLTVEGDTVWYLKAPLKLKKEGTGKWTVNGDLFFEGDITVAGGTLVLGANVDPLITQINVDAGTLHSNNVVIQSYINVNNATLSGSVIDAYGVALTNSTLKLNVNSFTDGDYDKIISQGDFTLIPPIGDEERNILDITVNAAIAGERIQLIEVQGVPGGTFDKVFVNGKDITDNTEDTPGAEFVWVGIDEDQQVAVCELLSLINKEGSGIDSQTAEKTVKAIQYYDLTGRPTTKEAKGFVIQKITYTDNTQAVQKSIINN
jgi:autotransporter-associated beta strand protein